MSRTITSEAAQSELYAVSAIVESMHQNAQAYRAVQYDALHWTLAREIEQAERAAMDARNNELRVRREFEDLKKQAWAQKWIAGTYPKTQYGDCEECGVHPGEWHLGGCGKA